MTVRVTTVALLALGVSLAACRGAAETTAAARAEPAVVLPQSTAAPLPDPSVVETIAKVLATAHHPGLTWSPIGDVVADLGPLYETEPDKLLWFDGTTPGASGRADPRGAGRGRRSRPRPLGL